MLLAFYIEWVCYYINTWHIFVNRVSFIQCYALCSNFMGIFLGLYHEQLSKRVGCASSN